MAAAADRPAGDVLDRVSPELVLVDPALSEEMRRRLEVPDDTLARIERMRMEPRLSVDVHEVEVDDQAEAEKSALAGSEPLPVPATAHEPAHHAGIEDLLVIPEELPSVPATQLVAPDEGVTRLVPEPQEIGVARVAAVDDLIVVAGEDRAQRQSTRGSYPALPSPSSDADEVDPTDVVLRLMRDHIEPETPPKRRRGRLLSYVSLFAALSSIAILAVDLQLGVSELPHWLPS